MLNIQDALLTQAKVLDARQRSTLTCLIEKGLRMRLRAAESMPAPVRQKPMPVFHGKGGFAPGLSGLNTREMLDRLDMPDDAARCQCAGGRVRG